MTLERKAELFDNLIDTLLDNDDDDLTDCLLHSCGMGNAEIEELLGDNEADLVLEEDDYIWNDRDSMLQIDKQVFDDFVLDRFIRIKLLGVEDKSVQEFIMVSEDDGWIYCEYF